MLLLVHCHPGCACYQAQVPVNITAWLHDWISHDHYFCSQAQNALRQLSCQSCDLIMCTGIVTTALTTMLGQARVFAVLGREHLLPIGLAKIHPRRFTPMNATILTGICSGSHVYSHCLIMKLVDWMPQIRHALCWHRSVHLQIYVHMLIWKEQLPGTY